MKKIFVPSEEKAEEADRVVKVMCTNPGLLGGKTSSYLKLVTALQLFSGITIISLSLTGPNKQPQPTGSRALNGRLLNGNDLFQTLM